MTNTFIFHGIDSHPQDNWFPWLKKELESLDCRVIVPQFPTLENQTLENWLAEFEKHNESYNRDSILIGHSLGGNLVLRVLERYPVKIKAAFMDAVQIGVPPITDYQGRETFEMPYNWELIKSRSNAFYVFHSDNDPWINIENGRELAHNLGIELTLVPNAGHFNKESGYTKFEKLLEKIKSHI